jgi:hypothetical protein
VKGPYALLGFASDVCSPSIFDAYISRLLFAAAAMEADQSDDKSDIEEPQQGIMDDDEAAEILEAMLGLAPAVQASEPSKRRKKGSSRVSWQY